MSLSAAASLLVLVLVAAQSLIVVVGMSLPGNAIDSADRYCADHNLDSVCICDQSIDPMELKPEDLDLRLSLERSMELDAVQRKDLILCEFQTAAECRNPRTICVEKELILRDGYF